MQRTPSADGKQSWLQATGQMWKLGVSLGFALLGLSCFGLMVLGINEVQVVPGVHEAAWAALGILLGAGALLWLSLSVRCPACRGRAAWHVMRTAEANAWVYQLVGSQGCPICADGPGPR